MKKLFVLLFALGFVVTVRAQEGTLVKAGDPVPSFSVEMVDGTVVDIAGLKGKVVVINFWATWCPPCRAELRRVQAEIVDRFAGDEFAFIAISRGEDKPTVMKFREENSYAFPMGLDPDGRIFAKFAQSGIPRNFIIDREGKIAAAEIGYNSEIFAELISKIEKTLNAK